MPTLAYTKTVDGLPTGNRSLPCDIRAAPVGPALGMAIVAGLDGNIAILNEQNQLVSTVDVAALIGDLGSIHPHDALFLPNGDFVVGTWNPGYVSYWKKLKSDE